jgi:predicted nucleic acid-binding protein
MRPSRAAGCRFKRATSFRADSAVIYLLDTNAISALMRADTRIASWLSSVRADDRVVVCTIARGEILFGLERLAQGRRRAELEAKAQNLFGALPCEAVPPSAGDLYAN